MMYLKSLCAALCLCLTLPSSAALAQNSLPQLSGEPGRVVILDASGSMRNPSFTNPRRERMEIGREFLTETFDELSGQNDTTKTSLIVFGADQRLTWDSVAAQHGGNPSNYPASGALCRDSSIGLPYVGLGANAVDTVRTVGRNTVWGGMTLIHVSINQALASFDPKIGGQIILISDMTDVNCLPAGAATICEAIAPSLREIRRQGGEVSAVVFETPTATARAALSACMWTSTHAAPTNNPDVDGIVTRALSTVPLTPRLIAGGVANLDPNGIDVSGGAMTVRPSGASIILANGPLGDVDLPLGDYDLAGSLDSVTWTSSVSLRSAATDTVTVDPARLIIQTAASGGGAPATQFDLTITRPSGQPVARLSSYRAGDSLELANGEYVLSGVDSSGQRASATVSLELGTQRNATLTFGSSSTATAVDRDVTINLRYARPTLDTGQTFSPSVQLSGPGVTGQQITTSGFNGKLAAGDYTISVNSLNPHVLPFDVSTGGDRLVVDLVVTPGIFVARTSGREGIFELRDSSGASLFTFVGNEVRHSIADGQYEIQFRRDGQSTVRTFEVSAGDRVTLPPF